MIVNSPKVRKATNIDEHCIPKRKLAEVLELHNRSDLIEGLEKDASFRIGRFNNIDFFYGDHEGVHLLSLVAFNDPNNEVETRRAPTPEEVLFILVEFQIRPLQFCAAQKGSLIGEDKSITLAVEPILTMH